jgi:hypothetical protein
MTLVLTAWCIQEVLDMPILKKLRENAEDRRETIFQCEGYPPLAADQRWSSPDVESDPPVADANPTRQGDFSA